MSLLRDSKENHNKNKYFAEELNLYSQKLSDSQAREVSTQNELVELQSKSVPMHLDVERLKQVTEMQAAMFHHLKLSVPPPPGKRCIGQTQAVARKRTGIKIFQSSGS